MHELSIAVNIVELATEEAEKANARKVLKLVLEIGSLSGVLPEALEFAMEEAIKGSMLENAAISYNYIPAIANCPDCCNEFETDDYFKVCPVCNSTNTFFVKGKELNIKSIEVLQD
jgi:hydrogenase nickel incorporation protein HypA/HybF